MGLMGCMGLTGHTGLTGRTDYARIQKVLGSVNGKCNVHVYR